MGVTLPALIATVMIIGLAPSVSAQQQSAANEAGKPVVPPDTKILTDLAYVENGHERQKLDLYIPGKNSGPHPVIIWIHGREGGGKMVARTRSKIRS
jgi:acetyl esterase/lipase